MRKPLVQIVFTFFFFHTASSQTAAPVISQVVYLAGNTAGANNTENLVALHATMLKETAPVTLIYNGDILHKHGLNGIPTAKDSAFIRLLLDVVKDIPNAQVYFTPGDLDWDNSGKDGWKDVKRLEKLIDGIAGKKIFLPETGCPGPVSIELGEDITLALINTPWWIHPYDRPHAPSTECDVLVEDQFIEELEGVLEDAGEKNVLIVGHHPIISHGNYGGRVPLAQHFSPPLIGTFEAAFHQNIGTPKDISYPAYKEFATDMNNLMQDYSPFIYASAHDYNLQVLGFEKSYQVVSGSITKKVAAGKSDNTVYKSNNNGFIKLSYYDDGKVMMDAVELSEGKIPGTETKELYQSSCHPDQSGAPVNTRFTPCKEKIAPAAQMNSAFADSIGTAVAGPEYKAGFLKKAYLGSLYRTSWTATIHVPYLNLDTARGGLTATGRGGGRQTHSLSLDGGDGKSYVFRSVDKDPIKALDPILRKTFVVGVSRQVTATQQPYGAMPVSYLLNATTIYHENPVLYLLPNDPKLGMFQKEYGGMLGMLEEKPKKGKHDNPGSFEADDVVRSYDLFRKLYKDHDNRVDATAFARARIFDIWIGDWGRHEDNWKWAGFKDENKTTYYPIPRDRDHAFSRWNGLLPYLASRHWALPNAENFDYHFHDLSSLTWTARHLDRFVLTPLDKDDWLKLTKEFESSMTDQLIDSAIFQFPKVILPLAGNIIDAKLKSRRAELEQGITKYYKLLAHHVDVVGSNKAEFFKITGLKTGEVEVTMFDKDKGTNGPSGAVLYQRLFKPEDTKSINIYGLDGDDVVIMEGVAAKKILVRIFGGKGNDVINNTSVIPTGKKFARVYVVKNEKKDSIASTAGIRIVRSDDMNLIEYHRQAFHYDTYVPLPFASYSPDEGFTFGFGVSYTFHHFGEIGYSDQLFAAARVSTENYFQVRLVNEVHHAVKNWDWLISTELFAPNSYVYFYGLGNETEKIDSLPKSFYRSHYNAFNGSTGLQKTFWRKSRFIAGVFYENNDEQIPSDNFLSQETDILGVGKINFIGGKAILDIDFRDNPYTPKHGVRLYAEQTYSYLTNEKKDFGNSEVSLEFYQSSKTLIPITLGIRGGATHAGGDVPFYKLSTLGRTTHLRGYLRDRFTGNTAAYLQNQLSVEFGSVQTFIAPLTIGIFGFYDVGRVWIPDESSKTWHAGYGGGFYLTPLFEMLTTKFSIEFSEEEKKGLFAFGLGLRI